MRLIVHKCIFLFGLIPWLLPAQSIHPDAAYNAARLAKAEAFIISYKNDSAQAILSHLMVHLAEQEQLDSPFGLRVQLAQGTVFEHNDRDTAAVRLLLHVKESSQKQKQWATFTEACLVLANLHENMERRSQCLLNLKDAQSAIGQNRLDSIYPFYAIRMSSYYRVFEAKEDSAVYYANEALRTAPKFGLVLQEAWGHMLMAALSRKSDPKKMLEHYHTAIPLFLKIDDNKGLSLLMGNVSKHYLEQKQFKDALAYNASSILFAQKSLALGDNMGTNLYSAYGLRGEIYRQLGRLDSALHYQKKGYEFQLALAKLVQDQRVIEIDARYNDENRLKQIAVQAHQIRAEKTRRNLLLLLFLAMLLLALALAYFYNQLRQANRKTAKQAEQLKSLDAAKSRFFANVSHELRTPLTLMLGPIQSLLQENNLSEKQSRLLKTAHKSGKGLQTLVNEILNLQKLEAGKMELIEKPTAIVPFFGRYAAQFESFAQRKEIEFSFETVLDKNLVVLIDQEKCRQVLYNLLSNAFKFTPAGGAVTVQIRDEGRGMRNDRGMRNEESGMMGGSGKVTVQIRDEGRGMRNDRGIRDEGPGMMGGSGDIIPDSSSLIPHSLFLSLVVSDTGSGIHPDDIPHLFDRYFQTNRPDKPAEGGTGIGLSLCHEYAKLFGGKIEVESPDPRSGGKGSVFRVTFPVKVEAIAQAEENQAIEKADVVTVATISEANEIVPSDQDTSRPTILVVEDNPELQDYIRLVLEEKYNVVTAENGQAALDFMRGEIGMRNEGPGMMGGSGDIIPHPSSLIPDLVLSDLMMPVMDGYQLLEKLKTNDATRHLPVIMLTARAEARDRLKALRIGVDDYLTKPFDEEELLVRIENLLANSKNRHLAEPIADSPIHDEMASDGPFISEPDRVWLESFEAYVQKNLANDALSIPSLAFEFAMSESTLLRQLKRLTGLSPVQYLQEVRLDKARQFLENRSYDSIAKVADKVGYSDARSFSRSFKQRFGKLPSDFLSA